LKKYKITVFKKGIKLNTTETCRMGKIYGA